MSYKGPITSFYNISYNNMSYNNVYVTACPMTLFYILYNLYQEYNNIL